MINKYFYGSSTGSKNSNIQRMYLNKNLAYLKITETYFI